MVLLSLHNLLLIKSLFNNESKKIFFKNKFNIVRNIQYKLATGGKEMIHNNFDMKRWKLEQIKYFRKYQSTFPKNSKEYKILEESIKKLESTLE